MSRLRELYQLDSQYTEYSKVGARVIGMTTDNWHSSLKIDKGTDDGIQAGMNVIASGGLVGIILKRAVIILLLRQLQRITVM